jgi:hypothetical protein
MAAWRTLSGSTDLTTDLAAHTRQACRWIPLGVGVLYSTTTISGPPLAPMFDNQGVDKKEFRAALGTVRVAKTVMTAVVLLGSWTFQLAKHSLGRVDRPRSAAGPPARYLPAPTYPQRDFPPGLHELLMRG